MAENIEMKAQAISQRIYELFIAKQLPSDRCMKIITAINIALEDLENYQKSELINIPSAKMRKEEARQTLSNATLLAHELLHEFHIPHELVGEYADLVKAANCLLDYLHDMADENRAKLYWELRSQRKINNA